MNTVARQCFFFVCDVRVKRLKRGELELVSCTQCRRCMHVVERPTNKAIRSNTAENLTEK